jgi:hypothetical protein
MMRPKEGVLSMRLPAIFLAIATVSALAACGGNGSKETTPTLAGCWNSLGSDPACNAYYAGYQRGHDDGYNGFAGYQDGYELGYAYADSGFITGFDYIGASRWCPRDPTITGTVVYPLDNSDGFLIGQSEGCEQGFGAGYQAGVEVGRRDYYRATGLNP